MRHFSTLVVILTHTLLFSQVSDDFSDGDFTNGTVWSGTNGDYTVNAGFELQLTSAAAGTSYLYTPHALSSLDDKEWRFKARQTFSPSGSNFGRIYLTSNNADLSTNPDGFYLQLGEAGSADAVRLIKCESGVNTEIIAATAGQIATSFSIGIQVIRDNTGLWSLAIDPSGGTAYVLEGTGTESTNLLGTYAGMLQTYTISNANSFFYDDIYIGDEILDLTPPVLVSASAINPNLIDVLFDEALDQVSAENVVNYDIQPFLSASSVTLDGINPALVHIVPSTPLANGSTYTLLSTAIADVAGNVSTQQSVQFGYFIPETPLPGDVIINEFICDPTPVVGLPSVEFVEIYNRSSKVFDVTGWKLGDASSDGTITTEWLLPGNYLVLTATDNVDSFTVATPVTSFPSLNNSGDAIVLRDNNGALLDSISYTLDWYKDDLKEDGGYSIERINPNDPCSDILNWSGSADPSGGTPGIVNSVNDLTPDTQAPSISQLIALAPNYLEVYYSEGMDSLSIANAVINVSPTLTIANNYILSSFPDKHILEFGETLTGSQTYTIELQNIADCWLNTTNLTGTFALPETPVAGDVVINEILFNPVNGGSDWVEVYNASSKLINLKDWQLANFDDDTIGNIKQFLDNFLLYPDSYAVFGKDTTQILEHYSAAVPGRFAQMDLPSYSNDSGTVLLMFNNQLMDQVSYQDDWHFKLLDSDDGVSLERLEPKGKSNDKNNWHSAAEEIGFGTPGRVNSQYFPAISNGEFSYTSTTISPDNDGYEDVLQVNYRLESPGYVGTFTVYDDRGRMIARVIESELLAASGTFIWDGLSENQTKASIGTYVGVFEAFDLENGGVFAQRKAFVVAGKL